LGIVEARGYGKGVGGYPQADGGAKYCVCPVCGYKVVHKKIGLGKSIPCVQIKCPKCGNMMRGSDEAKKVTKKYGNYGKYGDYGKYGYGYYGYGYYGKYNKQFKKALSLLDKLIKTIKDKATQTKLTQIRNLLAPKYGYYASKELAIQNTTEAIAKLKSMNISELNKIAELIKESKPPKRTPKLSEGAIRKNQEITENVISLDWIEEDKEKPFRFSGVALKANAESANGRFYPREVVESAVKEAKENIEKLTIMMGHPTGDDPSRIVGRPVEIDLNDNGEVTFVAELNNTSLGKDAQELLKFRPPGSQELSIRAEGSLMTEKVNGHKREKVLEMHLKGIDLVLEGAIPGAKVKEVYENKGGVENMTKEELLQMSEVQDLIEDAKETLAAQVEELSTEKEKLQEEFDKLQEKIKELETKLVAAEQERDKLKAEIEQKKLEEFINKKIEELDVDDKVKELLRKRVVGSNEKEVEESLKAELDYIKELVPLTREKKTLVYGKPPAGKTRTTAKTEADILKEGNEKLWNLAENIQKIYDEEDED